MENVCEKLQNCICTSINEMVSNQVMNAKLCVRKKMNASLRNHVVVLSETLHSESVHSPPPPPLSHQWLRVRMTRIPLFSPSSHPLTRSLSLSLSSPSTPSSCPSSLSILPAHTHTHTHTLTHANTNTHTRLPHAVKESEGSLRFTTSSCTRMAIGWHLQYVSVQHFNYGLCGLGRGS